MIRIEFSDEDKAALNYERYNHPHPFIQRKMEAVWLKSQGLAHNDIARLTDVCSTTLTGYIRDYQDGGIEALKAIFFILQASAKRSGGSSQHAGGLFS